MDRHVLPHFESSFPVFQKRAILFLLESLPVALCCFLFPVSRVSFLTRRRFPSPVSGQRSTATPSSLKRSEKLQGRTYELLRNSGAW
jgi:hypothetical protein